MCSYKVLNKSLSYGGCERWMFLVGLGLGGWVYSALNSTVAGVLAFGLMFWLGRIHAKDPAQLHLFYESRTSAKAWYDPGAKEPFRITFHGQSTHKR